MKEVPAMRTSWNTTIGLCAILFLLANLTYAGQKQLGTVGGTIKCSGVLQSSDKVNKNAQVIGGWFLGETMIDLGSLYQDAYTFTAAASGTASIANFWTDHPRGYGSLNCQFYSNTHDVQHDYIVDVGSTTVKVVKGREYSFVISSAVCDDQQYSFSLVLPGTTPVDGGNGGGGTTVTPNYVNVLFYANGGTLYEEDHFGASGHTVTTISSPYTRSILKGKTLLPYAPLCKYNGYKFAGWFTAGGDKIQDSYIVKSALSVYAQWHKKIEVKFDANGGYGSLGPQTFYSSEPAALLRNSGKIKNTGYAFKGWKEKNGNVIYTDGATFSPTADTTLYAVWEKVYVTVSFDGGGFVGEGSLSSRRYVPGEKFGELPDLEPQAGYSFAGWFDASGNIINEDSFVPSTDVTLNAKWVSICNTDEYTLSYVEFQDPDEIFSDVASPAVFYGRFTTQELTPDYAWSGSSENCIWVLPKESGFITVRFSAETRGGMTLLLRVDCSDGVHYVTDSDMVQVYLQEGDFSLFSIILVDRYSYDEIVVETPISLNFTLQLGGNESLLSVVDVPDAPCIDVSGNHARLSWDPMVGATEYQVYRNDIMIAAVNSTTYVDEDPGHESSWVQYYLKAIINGQSSVSGYVSDWIELLPSFSCIADDVDSSCHASSFSIPVDANIRWGVHVDPSDSWLHVDGAWDGSSASFAYGVQTGKAFYRYGSYVFSLRVDDNMTQSERSSSIVIKPVASEYPQKTLRITQQGRGSEVAVNFMEKAGSSSRTYSEGEAYGDLPTPERTGYTFLGWTIGENGGEFVTGDMLASADTTELYPQWRPNTYSIHFNANGGSGSMLNQTVTYDTGWQFAKCKFSKAGSAFLGWATAPDGTVLYGDETDGENLSVVDGAVVDLYAVWGDATRHYGPWGYDPETIKDDVAASTLANISLSINGAGMAEGDVVAAYDSCGRLRAIGKVASANGRLGVSLSMNVTAGTELMFLLWKKGTQVSDICVADTWITAPAPGTVNNEKLLLAGTPETEMPFRYCQISLGGAGWHLVSFNALPADPSPAVAFAAVADKIGQVVRGSKVWNPVSGGRLVELEVGVGYWVQTKADDVEWTVVGTPDPGVEISLSKGWNLVGYPLPKSASPATVLKTAYNAGKFTQIVDGSKVYPGRLDSLEPGKGYWVYAPAACTITFDQN